jgi:hypothetical protein
MSKPQGEGQLEIYAPRTFTTERPAVSFTSQTYNMAIEDHPLAARLPKASEKPCLHPAPEEFREFAVPTGAPETLADYLAGDVPMVSLRVTSFHNGTLVGLAWPHTLMDVMGQQALVRAWSLVLAGKMSEVPPMLGARKDALIEAADAPQEAEEEYILKPQILKLRLGCILVQSCGDSDNLPAQKFCREFTTQSSNGTSNRGKGEAFHQ